MNEPLDEINKVLIGWVLDWVTEEKPVYTHCAECGCELSAYEKEHHDSICQHCADIINYGGGLGVNY